VPQVLLADKPASHEAARRAVLPGAEHRQYRRLDNRAEYAHRPIREREQRIRRSKNAEHAQRILAAYDPLVGHVRWRLPRDRRRTFAARRAVTGAPAMARTAMSPRRNTPRRTRLPHGLTLLDDALATLLRRRTVEIDCRRRTQGAATHPIALTSMDMVPNLPSATSRSTLTRTTVRSITRHRKLPLDVLSTPDIGPVDPRRAARLDGTPLLGLGLGRRLVETLLPPSNEFRQRYVQVPTDQAQLDDIDPALPGLDVRYERLRTVEEARQLDLRQARLATRLTQLLHHRHPLATVQGFIHGGKCAGDGEISKYPIFLTEARSRKAG
jgi:hypothetical protein